MKKTGVRMSGERRRANADSPSGYKNDSTFPVPHHTKGGFSLPYSMSNGPCTKSLSTTSRNETCSEPRISGPRMSLP
jgi:hypothetical protein